MNTPFSRRQFLTRTAALSTLALAPGLLSAADFRGRLHRAMIVPKITEEALKLLKDAGFEGVETTHICPEPEAEEGRGIADKMGMKVHSVLRGWMEFTDCDNLKISYDFFGGYFDLNKVPFVDPPEVSYLPPEGLIETYHRMPTKCPACNVAAVATLQPQLRRR